MKTGVLLVLSVSILFSTSNAVRGVSFRSRSHKNLRIHGNDAESLPVADDMSALIRLLEEINPSATAPPYGTYPPQYRHRPPPGHMAVGAEGPAGMSPDPEPDAAWINDWTWIGVNYKTKNTVNFGPWWTKCQNFTVVNRICFYGSVDESSAGQPYSIAGIQLFWEDGTSALAGRTTDSSTNDCYNFNLDGNEVITSIKISNIDDTNGDIDEVTIYTNKDSSHPALQFGGGSGNSIHNSTTISSSSAVTTGSGLLCGIAATFQDADTKNDPLITQVAFFFLQPVETVTVSGIQVTTYQPTDSSGFSLAGQFSQQELCPEPGATPCNNEISVQEGQSATTEIDKSYTHGQSFTNTESIDFTTSATAGDPDVDSISFSTTIGLSWSQETYSSDTTTKSTSFQQGSTGTVTMQNSCECPMSIPPDTMCTFYYGQKLFTEWQNIGWNATATYTLTTGLSFSRPIVGTTSGNIYSGSLDLINITCGNQVFNATTGR